MSSEQRTSRIPEFYKKPIEERLKIVAEFAGLTEEEVALLKNFGNLDRKIADSMIENVIGAMSYPFAVAVNFLINGKDYIVPMVIEEASVVAAASNAARVMRRDGGIKSVATQPIMIGQIQVLGVKDPWYKRMVLLEHKEEILQKANEVDPVLVKFGGGARDLEARVVESPRGPMLIVHLLVDVRDAMGANAVNTMAEKVAPMIERLTGGRVLLRIISNLADRRLVRSWVKVYKEDIGGEEVVDAIVDAWAFAAADPYRAATHNKGIMNGVIAVALATAQDHRAIEAGAHAYAARTGRYMPLSTWEKDQDGNLVGTLEMPMAVGTIGGATKVHPVAKIALKILGVKTATELAEVMGAVGLAQNFAALRALATEGIQKGHMRLHARNLAIMAGATGDLIDRVVEIMVSEGKINFAYAQELVNKLSKEGRA
ncbi:hydroxymethylglutaryl-CoA reductase, degradative [Thermofilum pendens]|uniref:3-hydroxy-3-methylglutaryl coenzyme A reductase n=1 Tax=Thermofilum pendens (strain DSM 2475 / Hrk 5) TaxID=368408 RepID=A1RYP8_THEPD|nr:hydroxymethylglutaryl-CoA reductase, degradative [Thermofilum pendens]ABL78328.1 hydroxymethylglutaryl-CoA reductase, degradative [Thermofilum pendens Hrk 5]